MKFTEEFIRNIDQYLVDNKEQDFTLRKEKLTAQLNHFYVTFKCDKIKSLSQN